MTEYFRSNDTHRSLNYSQIDAHHNRKVKIECHEVTRIRAIWKLTSIYALQESGQHYRVVSNCLVSRAVSG